MHAAIGPHRLNRPRALLRRGRFSHRSLAPRFARDHHPCAFRPRALRLGGLCLPPRHGADLAQAPGRSHDRDGGLRRDPDAQRGRDLVSSRRPRAGLRAGSRVASKGETWVASGDYKLESDGVSPAFEPIRCHAFITESTFGLPIYRWRPQAEIFAAIDAWRRENIAAGTREHSLRLCARQGAAAARACRPRARADRLSRRGRGDQRALSRGGRRAAADALATDPRTAIRGENKREFASAAHCRAALGRREPLAQALRRLFRRARERLDAGARETAAGAGSTAALRFPTTPTGRASSRAIEATGAERILVTHGYTEPLTRYLREKGFDARALATAYGDDEDVGRGRRRKARRRRRAKP